MYWNIFNSPPDQNKHLFSFTEKALKFSIEKLPRINFRGMVLKSVVFFFFIVNKYCVRATFRQVLKRLCSELLQEMGRVQIGQRGVYCGVKVGEYRRYAMVVC